MATRTRRQNIAGFIFFEVNLSPNEVLVLPVHRSVSKNGDSTLAIMASTGTLTALTIEHASVVDAAVPKGQAYVSSVSGDYPAKPNPAAFARVWTTDHTTAANDIYEIHQHASALRITAPAAGGFVVVYGDY